MVLSTLFCTLLQQPGPGLYPLPFSGCDLQDIVYPAQQAGQIARLWFRDPEVGHMVRHAEFSAEIQLLPQAAQVIGWDAGLFVYHKAGDSLPLSGGEILALALVEKEAHLAQLLRDKGFDLSGVKIAGILFVT